MGRAVEPWMIKRTGMARDTPLLQTWAGRSHGMDAAVGTRETHSHIYMLLGCVRSEFELKLIQVSCSLRCVFCSTGWEDLKASLGSMG